MDEPPPEAPGGGFIVGKLKEGVAPGDANPEGVEACSVANKSGVGAEMGRLHPTNKRKRKTVEKSLRLLIVQFN